MTATRPARPAVDATSSATSVEPVADGVIATTPHPRSGHRGAPGEARAAYLLTAPNLVLLGLFVLFPLGYAAVISFQHTDGFGSGRFVGVDNYARLFTDSLFWRATGNTVLFTAIVTPASMGLGLAAALLLNSALPARRLFRSILVLPMAISGVATALLGGLLFDQNSGLIDKVLEAVRLPGVNWQSGGVPAFASVALTTVWWRVGFNMLIYLAALQGLSSQLQEAARLDGATPWQRLRFVTVPLLGPVSFFLVIVNIIYSFQVFDIVFVLTGGGPQNATTVLVTYAYDTGFVTRDQGYSAAIGMLLLIMTLIVTGVRWRRSRTREVTE